MSSVRINAFRALKSILPTLNIVTAVCSQQETDGLQVGKCPFFRWENSGAWGWLFCSPFITLLQKEGKALNLPVDLHSCPQLWSWAVDHGQKDTITDTSWNGFSREGGFSFRDQARSSVIREELRVERLWGGWDTWQRLLQERRRGVNRLATYLGWTQLGWGPGLQFFNIYHNYLQYLKSSKLDSHMGELVWLQRKTLNRP